MSLLENRMMAQQPHVYVRALDEGDLERTRRWHSDPELYRTLVEGFRFVSTAPEREWLATRVSYSPSEVSLAICPAPGQEHIGNIYFRPVNVASRNAVLGNFIGAKAHRGRGHGYRALCLAMKHAFDDLGLERILFEMLADNQPAIRLYEEVGFRTAGRLRGHVFKGGNTRMRSRWEFFEASSKPRKDRD